MKYLILLILQFTIYNLQIANAAELSPGEAAGYTKLVGSDSDGLFTYYADVDATGALKVTGVALALPTGASTEATLAAAAASLVSLDNKAISFAASDYTLDTFRFQNLTDMAAANASLSTINSHLNSIDSKTPSGLTVSSTRLLVDGSGVTQPVSGTFWQATQPVSISGTVPVSAAALPLPSGASTSSLQTTGNTALGTINTTLGSPFQAGGSIGNTTFASTQSGTWNINNISGTVSLPTDAATETTSSAINSVLNSIYSILGTINTYSNTTSINTTNAATQASQNQSTSGMKGVLQLGSTTTAAPTYTNGATGALSLTTAGALRVDNSAVTQPISASSLPLPTLAATSTNQATEIASLSSIDGKLTSPLTVTGALTDTQLRATAVPVSLATLPALAAGSAVIGHVIVDTAPTTAVTGTFWQSTQPVSIATAPVLVAGSAIIGKVGIDQTTPGTTNGVQVNAALPAGSNVIGHVIADSGSTTVVTGTVTANATLSAETTKVIGTVNQGTSPWVISGALTDTQLRASAVPVSLSTLPALVAGSAVIGHVIADASSAVIGHVIADSGSTTAVTGNVASTVADGANVVLGAKADAKSTATDTTAITIMSVLKQISASVQAPPTQAATQSGTWTVQPGNTPNTSPWLMTINDGTNSAKVQAASTTPAAADKALTVVQSPNGGNPCVNSAATLMSITGATSGTSNVQIIALSGSTKIYICSLTVIGVSGTTPTFSLVSGTGSNCASTAATVLQAWTTAAGTLYQFANPLAVVAAGSALCYKGTGTTPVQNYAMTYVQQ